MPPLRNWSPKGQIPEAYLAEISRHMLGLRDTSRPMYFLGRLLPEEIKWHRFNICVEDIDATMRPTFFLTSPQKSDAPGYCYHNAGHTALVVLGAFLIGSMHGLSKEDLRLLLKTACFHDYDYAASQTADDPEAFSILSAHNKGFISSEELESVLSLNTATKLHNRLSLLAEAPASSLKVILSDADLWPSFGISFPMFLSETALVEQEIKRDITLDLSAEIAMKVGSFKSLTGTGLQSASHDILYGIQKKNIMRYV